MAEADRSEEARFCSVLIGCPDQANVLEVQGQYGHAQLANNALMMRYFVCMVFNNDATPTLPAPCGRDLRREVLFSQFPAHRIPSCGFTLS